MSRPVAFGKRKSHRSAEGGNWPRNAGLRGRIEIGPTHHSRPRSSPNTLLPGLACYIPVGDNQLRVPGSSFTKYGKMCRARRALMRDRTSAAADAPSKLPAIPTPPLRMLKKAAGAWHVFHLSALSAWHGGAIMNEVLVVVEQQHHDLRPHDGPASFNFHPLLVSSNPAGGCSESKRLQKGIRSPAVRPELVDLSSVARDTARKSPTKGPTKSVTYWDDPSRASGLEAQHVVLSRACRNLQRKPWTLPTKSSTSDTAEELGHRHQRTLCVGRRFRQTSKRFPLLHKANKSTITGRITGLVEMAGPCP